MLIVALVLAVIGLAALVTAVVTSNELVAWVCIAASVLGVLLLIIDALRERQSRDRVAVEADDADGALPSATHTVDETYETFDAEYPSDAEVERVTEVDPAVDVVDVDIAESDGSDIVESEAPEVHYVRSDESDSAMEVRFETDEAVESAEDLGHQK